MDARDKRNQETERFHLFDVSSEDDFLIAPSSGRRLNMRTSRFTENQKEFGSFGLSDTRNAQDGDNTTDLITQKEQTPELSESAKPERTRNVSNCNLRKSLAWDSAFFTSAGVLDPEELSIINKGFSKAEAPLLPGIQEDARRSAESNSTFDSDSLTLESIEIDLFEDIRASIQKSSKSSNIASFRTNTRQVERGTQSLLRSSKRIELPYQNMTKPVAASKRQILEKTPKKASLCPRVAQPVSRGGEPNSSSLKPPKILGRTVPFSAAPTKRTSLGASRIKVERNSTKAVSGKGDPVVRSKKPGLGDSGSITPRSSPSPKSSSSGSSFFSSVSRLGSPSSDFRGKSPAKSSRNKTSPRNVNPAYYGPTHTDSMRTSPRNKIDSGNSPLSTYLVSMSKYYSSLSPASSIDGWSSESSSSTSTVNQRSNNSKTSSSPRSGFSIDNDAPQALDLMTNSHNQASFRYGSYGTELPSQCDNYTSARTVGLSHLASTNVSRSIKPSGLRMPSPKIGFFDAEKTAPSTPRGGLRGVRNCSPKDGPGISCLNGSAIKTKPGKTHPARTVTGTGKMKTESVHSGVLCPTPSIKLNFLELHEQANASPQVRNTSKKVEGFHYKLSEVHKSPRCEIDGHAKIWEVGEPVPDALKFGTDSGPNAEVNGGLDALKNNLVAESEGQVPLIAMRVGPLREDWHCSSISIEKENFFKIEDQVDILSRTVGAVDLNTDVLNVMMEKKSSLLQFDVNNQISSVP